MNLIKMIMLIKNNPQLARRAISEIRLHGFKKTILKIKNKYHRVVQIAEHDNEAKSFDHVIGMFNNTVIIPGFRSEKPIDIIIPVFNGLQFLEPLIGSIVKNTLMRYRIIICDDKSSDEKVLPLLKKLKADYSSVDIILLENEKNSGFIKTVNNLVTYTENHFVLLNTDTEVPPYWLERLMYPIFEMKNIASTTPFTNSGTICSFPDYLEDNPIFENMNLAELDGYFQYVDFKKTFIEIPTGIGFCMGVNKDLVNKIGMFDEVFGKGYGEENDWCQRAIKEGYKNIHVTNLFVYHKHGGSFSDEEKQRLISQNLAVLHKKHPDYDNQVQALVQKNELENLRIFLKIKIKNTKLNTVLIFDHGLGGGANHYIDETLAARVESSEMIILIRYDFNVFKKYNIQFMADNLNYKFASSDLSEVFSVLYGFKINEIFLNSLVSYPNLKKLIDNIILLKEKTKAKMVLPVHDFFSICPNYTLLDDNMRYCAVPDDLKICENCLKNNRNEFKIFEQEMHIEDWRAEWSKIIAVSERIICFSNSSKEIFLKAYKDNMHQVSVIPHDISGRYEKIYNPDNNSDKLVIGVLGAINEAKGANIIKKLAAYIDDNRLNAKIVLIGQISVPVSADSFEMTGRYDKKSLPDIVQKYHITKFLLPAICPETFSYTAEEIMQMGYPLIVFDLGAPAERVKHYDLGQVIKIDELYESLFGKI